MLSTILFATVMTVASHRPTYVLSSGHQASCNGADVEDVDVLRDRYGNRFFWYRDNGRSYVVRDAAALDAIEELFRPQRELGREQSHLGRQQSALGREQSRLAWDPDRRERMRDLGDQMRELGDKMRAVGRDIDRKLPTMMREFAARGVAREVE
jgi:hypothetical protein